MVGDPTNRRVPRAPGPLLGPGRAPEGSAGEQGHEQGGTRRLGSALESRSRLQEQALEPSFGPVVPHCVGGGRATPELTGRPPLPPTLQLRRNVEDRPVQFGQGISTGPARFHRLTSMTGHGR